VSGAVKRSTRVASRVHEELAGLLRNMGDPRLAGVLVTRVEVPDDLQLARVFVRHELGAAQDAGARKAMLRGLEAASGRLQREVARAVVLRRAPTLRFVYDEGQDNAFRVEEILREIQHEDDDRRKDG
jgi:ribosome-binding factor A